MFPARTGAELAGASAVERGVPGAWRWVQESGRHKDTGFFSYLSECLSTISIYSVFMAVLWGRWQWWHPQITGRTQRTREQSNTVGSSRLEVETLARPDGSVERSENSSHVCPSSQEQDRVVSGQALEVDSGVQSCLSHSLALWPCTHVDLPEPGLVTPEMVRILVPVSQRCGEGDMNRQCREGYSWVNRTS